ncbi:MAG: ureidoglycolate hydrolase [Rhodobacteraceae bacterium]|nr:ureidoglycolate hydrolase [Paracoccaceae bacterium]
MIEIPLHTGLTAAIFAPFGAVIDRPAEPGTRKGFTDYLGSDRPDGTPAFHTNHMAPMALPMTLDVMERHPHTAQAFVPLDVSRYLVTVAPSDAQGAPDLARMQAFVVPGSLGVIYGRNVWHAPAAVLDRHGSFAVLMWRVGGGEDDVFVDIDPVSLVTDCTTTTLA